MNAKQINTQLLIVLLSLNAAITPSLLSQTDRSYDSRQVDLKQDNKSVRYQDKNKKGCCKIRYASGGYDFFVSTEDECRANLYFDRFLGENTSLCFHWKE